MGKQSIAETSGGIDTQPFILQRADPYIVCYDNTYYFTATVPEYDRIEIRAASTVEGLKFAAPHTVWYGHAEGVMSRHIWAPELHKTDGRFYIYFAAGASYNKWKIRPYVLECDGDPITGNWRELGKMQAHGNDVYSFTDFSLDMTVFEHRGERYCVWAEKVGQRFGISNLYIARMAAPNRLATVQVLLSTPDYDWEREGFWVNEGAAVLKRNGKIFIAYSASATGPEYCMGLLTADENADLLDPRVWRKSRLPVLATDRQKGIYGPGHNSFCVDENGRDLLVFHARTTDKLIAKDPLDDPNRHTFVAKVTFGADDTL
ncbi:MAG: family 43 glycosylhydrolase, partial [Clostridiales bacterium]|nr:family 43 glycosylhydrolase [Clostridiales bacterium]